MSNKFNFNSIIKGQQLIIFFDDNKTIVFKTENVSQGTRFVVFGDTEEGEKVLIPAFTTKELDTKYSNDDDKSQRANNCIDWESKTYLFKISRSLDIKEVYLLNAEGNLRKYDGAFAGNVSFDKSKFYLSAEPTYDFNNVKLLYFKTAVRQILLDSKKGSLLIDEKVSLLQQALAGIGEESQLKSIKPLTMEERVMFFVEAISKLPDIIDLFVYYQELENVKNLEINDVISQSELLQKLNIKTSFNFTKEELNKFKIKLEVIENNKETNILQVNLNLAYEIDDNKWSRNLIATEVKIKPKLKNKLNLLSNLSYGNDSMLFMNKFGVLMSTEDKEKTNIFFLELYSKIKEIDVTIKEFISLNDKDKNTVHFLIKKQQQWEENKPWLSDVECLARVKKDTENLNNTIGEIKKILVKNENNKQKILNDLIIKMKLVNNLQMLSYLQETLFIKSKEYLIASNVFYKVHNLSPKIIKEYANYYVKSKNQNNNLYPTDSVTEIDNLLNNNFSEFVDICKLLPIELHNKPIYIIFKLINFLDDFKNIEFNKLLNQEMTIKEEKMTKNYLSLLNFSDYQGTFSSNVLQDDELKMKLANSVKNSEEFKMYQQQLKDLRIKFWQSHDLTTLINELIDVYFVNEKQEILPKFSLEEHFLLEKQILETNIFNNDDSHKLAAEKLNKAKNILIIKQKSAKGFQEEVSSAFKIAKEIVLVKTNEESIKAGKWKVNDIVAVNSIKNIAGIKENQLTYFKVLQKAGDNFTVIILNPAKKWNYKIRDININNCSCFNFYFSKEDITFPNQEEIINSQLLINDYVSWKDETIPKYASLLSEKLQKINNPILGFVKIKNQNFFNDWEWKINLQKIKEKLLEIIDEEIEKNKKLITTQNQNYQQRLKTNEELKKMIVNDSLRFDFIEKNKDEIKNLTENVYTTDVIFSITYDWKFLGIYQQQTSAINFKINRDSSIAKKRLKFIKEEIENIKSLVLTVNIGVRHAVNNLSQLHNSIIDLLKTKKEEWQKLSNHTNLNLHLQNQQIMEKLKSDIDQLSEQLVDIKEKIVELNDQKIENKKLFYNDYLTFIRYYQQASEVTSSDIKKYLYWDKNYQIIKSKLAIYTGYDNFDEYKTELLSNIKSINIEDYKKSLSTISKTKFKELNWWQKIINKISWTWTKTKNAIAKIKTKNTTNFENLIKNLNINKSLISEINITLQEKNNWLMLAISEPWDQGIIEKELKYLPRQNSNDSAISNFEESNCSDWKNNSNNYSTSRRLSSDSGICSGQSSPEQYFCN